MDREQQFWAGDNEYQDLAREFEENIEIDSPDQIKCDVLRGCQCTFCATNVKYYEYRGS